MEAVNDLTFFEFVIAAVIIVGFYGYVKWKKQKNKK